MIASSVLQMPFFFSLSWMPCHTMNAMFQETNGCYNASNVFGQACTRLVSRYCWIVTLCVLYDLCAWILGLGRNTYSRAFTNLTIGDFFRFEDLIICGWIIYQKRSSRWNIVANFNEINSTKWKTIRHIALESCWWKVISLFSVH